MNKSSIEKTIKEAEHFIATARTVLKESSSRDDDCIYPSKESGACRRASMDLTRALADMRRP